MHARIRVDLFDDFEEVILRGGFGKDVVLYRYADITAGLGRAFFV